MSKPNVHYGQREVPTCLLACYILLFGLLLRALTGLHPYSGENTPPLFGDYEAQRHWMEIALNLKPIDWYRSTPDNDLAYWGLDYPPLSGYVSWLFGKFLRYVDPAALQLYSSRGYETAVSRAAMRFTVLFADLSIFFPALVLILGYSSWKATFTSSRDFTQAGISWCEALAFCITTPALILIDHGHFQYNNISLGLFVLSLLCFQFDYSAFGAMFFCTSLYFKQMGLYYGLAIFFYLLGKTAIQIRREGVVRTMLFVMKIFTAIILTTITCFSPWIFHRERMTELIRRLFPISRGLYESKVANVWCSISVLVKIHKLMPQQVLFKFCAVVTTLASLVFCIPVLLNPCHRRLCLATAGCSLAAYLFSYQVHEKQVLLPLMPICLLYREFPLLASWTSLVSMFSLFPLLFREGLIIPYLAITAIHMMVIVVTLDRHDRAPSHATCSMIVGASLLGAILHLLLVFATPPPFAPDIFELLNTAYACLHLCGIYFVLIVSIWSREQIGPETTAKSKPE